GQQDARPRAERARRGRRSRPGAQSRRRRLSRQTLRVQRAGRAARSAGAALLLGLRSTPYGARSGRSQDGSAAARGPSCGSQDRSAAEGIPASRISDAPRRSGRDAHDAARRRLELPLRPSDQRHRRAREPAAREDRSRFSDAAAAYRARRGLPARRDRVATRRMRLPALFRTTIFQLTLVYMALFGASVLALFTFIYWSTLGYLERQTQQIIEAEIRGLAEQVERRGIVGLADVITERVRRDTERRSIYLLVDAALRPIAGNVARWPERLDRRGEWVVFLKAEGDGGYTPVRALVLGVGPGFRLLVGRDVRELEQINEVFRRASVWGLGLTMGLSLLGGLLIGFSAQRRLAQINRTTRQIIAGNLSQRVPVTGGGDE